MLTLGASFVPAILRPDYTWPEPRVTSISRTTPPVPHVPSKAIRMFWGYVHRGLYRFSEWCCRWLGIYFDGQIIQLPFGLIMKWTDRTSIEEVVAMQMARAGGIPVPRVISCGEHAKSSGRSKTSILMTRLPGQTLENGRYPLEVDLEEPWLEELKTCVHTMRLWKPPSQEAVYSPIGTCLHSSRVPDHIMGPFKDLTGFYGHMFYPVSRHAFKTTEELTRH